MGLSEDIMYPPGYKSGRDVPESKIEDKRLELESLRDQMVRAKDLISSAYWREQVKIWQKRIKSIIGQYDPTSTTAPTDAVFGMGMLRQIYDDIDRPQIIIDLYERKKEVYDKLVRTKRPK